MGLDGKIIINQKSIQMTNTSKQIKLTPYRGQVNCGLIKVKDLVYLNIHPLNRRIDANHVNEFFNIIRDEGDTDVILKASELIVNEVTNTILDGNHRYPAILKAVNEGIIRPDAKVRVVMEHYDSLADEMDRIVELNTHSKNWQLPDYIDSFARWEEERSEYDGPYTRLLNFCLQHTLCAPSGEKNPYPKYRYGIAMIKGQRRDKEIKRGELEISTAELADAGIIHDELCVIRKHLGLPMHGTDIEGMALEWMLYRNSIDLKMLKRRKPSATVSKAPKGNRGDWRRVFLLIRDEQEVGSQKAR